MLLWWNFHINPNGMEVQRTSRLVNTSTGQMGGTPLLHGYRSSCIQESSSGCSCHLFRSSHSLLHGKFIKYVWVPKAVLANDWIQGWGCGDFWFVANLDRNCGSTGDLLPATGIWKWGCNGNEPLTSGVCPNSELDWIIRHPAGIEELVGVWKTTPHIWCQKNRMWE